MAKWLTLRAGRSAFETLRRDSFDPDAFGLLVGASGGPKWLVLRQLDRVLCERFLAPRSRPLDLLGSSIGTLRHACFAQSEPLEALSRLEEAYIEQAYDPDPTPEEVSLVSRHIVRAILGERGAADLSENDRRRCHVVTALCRRATRSSSALLLKAGLAASAAANLASRTLLGQFFERVVFSVGPRRFEFDDIATRVAPLSAENAEDAILASSSIPLLMAAVENIPGSPSGHYRDGGIIDYHFDLNCTRGDRLVLYPHFFSEVTPGWFDKALKWRRPTAAAFDRVLLVAPSPEMVERLPNSRIPDRTDFYRFDTATRQKLWRRTIAECERMAEEFDTLLSTGTLADHINPVLPS